MIHACKRKAGVIEKNSVFHIRQSYTNEKSRSDLVAQLWVYLVLRPISFYLTPPLINLGFSANAVTALGLVPLICGLAFILLGAISALNFIIGAALVNIWYLCDCIDGNIARFRGESSKFGALLDFIVGLIYHTFLPVCLGLGLYFASSERSVLALGLEIPRWWWPVVGGIELSAGLFRKVVSLQSQSIVGKQAKRRDNLRSTIWNVLPRAVLSFKAPLLLIAALTGALGFFLFSYAAYNLASLLAMIVLSLRKALVVDRQQFDEGENL